jgi:hypothetical protein
MSKFQPYEVSYNDETGQYHYDGSSYSNLDDLLGDIGHDIEQNTKEKSIDQKFKELKADLEGAIKYTEELQKNYIRLTGRRFIPDIKLGGK